MSDTRDKTGGTPAGTGVPVRQACFCVGVFFVLMLFFNGVAMYKSAKLLEYGRVRDLWLKVLHPVEQVSRLSGLFYVRQAAQDMVGKSLNHASVKKGGKE